MTDFPARIEQLRLFVVQHLPAETLANIVPVAILCLLAGVTVSVLGVKLSKVAFTGGFVGLGAVLGYRFGELGQYPGPLCALLAGGMFGVIGYQTFRLWVGLAVAAIVTTLAMGAFGYQKLVPYVNEFEQVELAAVQATPGETGFSVPTPQEQEANLTRVPRDVAAKFWSYVTDQDSDLERRAQVVALAAGIIGLFLGVLAMRWALILATSVFGTALVTAGMATLLGNFFPGSYQAFLAHPGVGGIAIGVFLMASFLLQAMLTRKPPADEPPARTGKS